MPEKKETSKEVQVIKVDFDVSGIVKQIDDSLTKLLAKVKKSTNESIKETFKEVSKGIKDSISRSDSQLTTSLSKLSDTAKYSFKSLGTTVEESQSSAVSKMNQSIESLTSTAASAIEKMKEISSSVGNITYKAITDGVSIGSSGQADKDSNKNKAPPKKGGVSGGLDALQGVSSSLGSVTDAFASTFEIVSTMAPGLTEAMQPFVDSTLGLVTNVTGLYDQFMALTTSVPALMQSLSTLFTTISAAPILPFVLAIAALVAVFATLYTTNEQFRESINGLVSQFIEGLGPGIETIRSSFDNLWNNALLPLYKAFLDFCNVVIKPLSEVLADIFVIAIGFVFDILLSLWNNVLVPLATFFMDTFSKAIQGVLEIWEVWKPHVQKIIDIFMYLWDVVLKPFISFISGLFMSAFDSVFKSIGDIIENVKGIFSGIIDFVVGIFTGNWKKAWEGVKDIFRNVFEGLGNVIKIPLNIVIDVVNKGIDGINSIGFDLPEWLGGKHFGLNVPKIPRLATGGIISQPTLALVGESGKEAVMPLERNTGWIQNLAGNISSQLNGGQMNQRSEKILLELLQAVKSLNLNIDGKRATSLLDNSKKELAMLR